MAQAQAAIPQQHRDFVDQSLRKHQVPAATRPTFFTAAVRNAAMFEAQLDAVLASDVDLVAAAVGVPAEVVTRIKQRGKTALALVGSVKHAQAALAAGVDLMFPRLAGDEASVAQAQAAIPQQHRDFVAQLLRKHQVPAATRPTLSLIHI